MVCIGSQKSVMDCNLDRWGVQTVLEMAGEDRMGLLHDAARIITNGGLDIKSLAVKSNSS